MHSHTCIEYVSGLKILMLYCCKLSSHLCSSRKSIWKEEMSDEYLMYTINDLKLCYFVHIKSTKQPRRTFFPENHATIPYLGPSKGIAKRLNTSIKV